MQEVGTEVGLGREASSGRIVFPRNGQKDGVVYMEGGKEEILEMKQGFKLSKFQASLCKCGRSSN